MTLEELKAELEKRDASIKKLEEKNAELLAEKKAAAKKAEETEDRLAKLEKAAKEKAEELEAEAAKKAGDWDKREAQLKQKHSEDLAAVNAELAKERSARDKLVIDNAISAHLDAAGVKPEFKEAARALLRSKKAEVKISDGGEFVGTLDGKPVAEAVTEWSKSDAGKHFIGNANSGGGAEGGGKGGGPKGGKNPWAKESFNVTEQLRLRKENPELASKLQAEAA